MRQEGLDGEGGWAQQFMGDRGLFQLKLQRIMSMASADANLEALAREYYLAHPEQFLKPERVRVSHILLSTSESGESGAKGLAKEIARQVEAQPQRFEELAREYSDDEGNAKKGGDLGFFSKGRMVQPFEDAAFALEEPGQIVGPIKTRFGYHIIRLDERQPESKQPFEVVKPRLIEQARKRVEQRAREDYLSKIRSAGNIESDQDAIKALVRPLPDPEGLSHEQRKESAD